jgi:hypothetical protein
MAKPANHLHKYKKVNLSETGEYLVYKCMKPACSHYVPIKLSEGKLCECNRCGEPMIITKSVLTHSNNKPMARPHCTGCIKRKNEKDVAALAEFISGTKI